MLKKLLIIPAIVLMSQGVFADKGKSPRPQPEQGYDEPQEDYQEQPPYYGGGYGGVPAQPCGGCAVVVPPPCYDGCYPPPPPPPPAYYGCGMPQCGTIVPPYGPPLRPWVPRPGYGYGRPPYGGGYGPRPMPYGGMPRGPVVGVPGGMVRRMSATAEGCKIEQGNNGEFSLKSANGVLYKSSIKGADANAEFVKAHLEKTSNVCGVSTDKALDI